MSIITQIRNGAKVAVFSRNHRQWLEQAVEVSADKPVTFRSAVGWASVETALEERRPLPIYFAPIPGGDRVEYVADLHEVQLRPSPGNEKTKALLRNCLPGTLQEGLWGKKRNAVKTLYVISNCRMLSSPVSQTSLKKLSDGKSIDVNYGRSYCVVFELDKLAEDGVVYPDEEHPGTLPEGATKTRTVNAYERNPKARKLCIEHYGWNCGVCGFNFAAVYGDIGKEFIHVHHLYPAAARAKKGQYQIDPIKDLRPVCPNCHAMLHTSKKPLSISQLKRRLREH